MMTLFLKSVRYKDFQQIRTKISILFSKLLFLLEECISFGSIIVTLGSMKFVH